jgi:hypothetical protein
MKVEFMDERPITPGDKWVGATLSLLYADTLLPIGHTIKNTRTSTMTAVSTNEDTTNSSGWSLRIHEITKNHESRLFCLQLAVDGRTYTTDAFEVRSKKTKPRATLRHTPKDLVSVDFKHKTHRVLSLLEWQQTYQHRVVDGSVDYDHPIYTCPLCRSTRDQGHTSSCVLHELLQQ